MRLRTRQLFWGFGVLAALIAVVQLAGSAAATAQNQAATQRVIVVLKNQVKNLPPTRGDIGARRSAVALTQAPITNQLSSSGARNVHSYDVVNAVSATVSPSEASALKSNPAVSEVVPDQIIHLAPPTEQAASGSSGGGSAPLPGACAPPGQVQLNPQAIETIHADSQNPSAKTARSLGLTGTGVTVGFIADGLDPNNQDFIRANGQHVIVDYKDFSGEGTGVPTGGEEEFGDASSIAAQGRGVYNVQGYSALGPNRQCLIRVEGVAPGSSLVALDVFGGEDAGFNSEIVQAIDYAVSTDHVNVLNESFGNNFYPDDAASLDLIKQANDEAVAAGTTVTVSSGDAGVTSTIGTPSTDPEVISAGATTTYRIDGQDGYGGARFPGVTGWLDNNISSFSSGGFEQSGRTVDVVAPGELNWALCSTDTANYFDCFSLAGKPTPVIAFGGTSESAPLTAGVAALVIQAYRQTHGGATPSPAVVKQIITGTADDIGAPAEQQGDGLIDAYKAGLAAESFNGASTPVSHGNTLVTGADQLNGSGLPGSRQTLTDTVTNNGSKPETVSLSTRAIGAYRSLKAGTVVLSDSGSPHITDWQGVTDNYEPFTFNVPQGQDRLNVSAAFQNAGNNLTDPALHARVRITLVDPQGRLAEYSVPQGDGNYGDVQITEPIPGRWTAYIYSRGSAAGGTTGPVVVGASSARYTSFGSVTPSSVRLAPGQTAPVRLTVSTPSSPGDAAGSILLSSGGRTQSTIAVTLRSLIPGGHSVFNGDLTGGNGRSFQSGELFTYQLNVPGGLPELNATVTLADNPNNEFSAWLVSPSGEAQAYGENTIPISNPPTQVLGTQLHVLSPQAGTWSLAIEFGPQVSGMALDEPFTVTTNESPIAVQSTVPNSASSKLPAGKASTFGVTIANNGPDPEVDFVDARLPGSTTEPLATQFGTTNTVQEPDSAFSSNVQPLYLVPTHTTSFAAQASTTGPQAIEFDAGYASGDPDIASTAGTLAGAAFSANPIEQGIWGIVPVEVGPFGTTGGPSETATTAMSVTTAAFDTAVSSPTGDLWETSADASAPFNPVVVGPGQSVTIPVTITPNAPSGSTVSGTLYVDDAWVGFAQVYAQLTGNDVASVPYTYTVK
ncbi:MAG TPA: S8 family serine peptidase [Solirubrobacteraceae bacterium]